MKYSLRSLMIDSLIALPFLVAGILAVWAVRETMKDSDTIQSYKNFFERGGRPPQPWDIP